MPAFPPKTDFIAVPDPDAPPVGASRVDDVWLDTLQDYILGLPTTDDLDTAVQVGVGKTLMVLFYDGALWPVRPDTSATGQFVLWVGPSATPVPSGGTATGGTRARAPFDLVALS